MVKVSSGGELFCLCRTSSTLSWRRRREERPGVSGETLLRRARITSALSPSSTSGGCRQSSSLHE
ncbi:hypothetical protein NL676_014165, partial [Syzygium grande]